METLVCVLIAVGVTLGAGVALVAPAVLVVWLIDKYYDRPRQAALEARWAKPRLAPVKRSAYKNSRYV